MPGNISQSCVKCGKTGGILFCNGCQKTLCFKHVNEHQNEIEKELEDLINQEDQYENEIKKLNETHYLFNEIDLWKKDSIEKIKQIAKQTKQELKQLIEQSNENLLKNSQQIKENLHLLKQSDDLSEIQLIKLSNQFNNLKKEMNSFQLIKSTNSFDLKIEKQIFNQIPLPIIPINDKFSPKIEQTHSNSQGSILIREIDPYGYYITIAHNGLTTDKEQDMIGWTIKREIDSYNNIIYRFPHDFSLKSKSFVKILSRQASQTLYSYEKTNTLIAQTIQTWGTGSKIIINRLMDANGNEKDVLTETFK